MAPEGIMTQDVMFVICWPWEMSQRGPFVVIATQGFDFPTCCLSMIISKAGRMYQGVLQREQASRQYCKEYNGIIGAGVFCTKKIDDEPARRSCKLEVRCSCDATSLFVAITR